MEEPKQQFPTTIALPSKLLSPPVSEPASASDQGKIPQKSSDSRVEESKTASGLEDQFRKMKTLRRKVIRYPWQIKLDAFMDNLYVQLFLSLLSIFALFADEIRMVAFSKSADTTFYSLLCISIGIFGVEIIVSSICKKDYFNSFFFWLDIISTVSLVGDIAWIVPESSSVGQTTTDITRQARAGRAARIIRLIRLIRLIRITKLYKEVQKQREFAEKQQLDARRSSTKVYPASAATEEVGTVSGMTRALTRKRTSNDNIVGTLQAAFKSAYTSADTTMLSDSTGDNAPKELRVSKIISTLTTQRVVILIIALSFCLPLLDLNSYVDPEYVAPYGVSILANAHESNMSSTDFAALCKKICDQTSTDEFYPLVSITGPDCGPYTFGISEDDLRLAETMISEYRGYRAAFDVRANTKLTAGLGIGRTLFLCVLLAVGAIFFAHDTNQLVLQPLESMMEKVKKLAINPMWFCLATDDDDLGVFSYMEKQSKHEEKYETQYLETLIVKIAKLLAVEFGEAGTKIIVSNLSNNDFLNPMVPGAKTYAVFGFCIINSFEEITELLQTKVILYLNQIAETVHSTIDKYLGSTNKNIGEAFLVLWKFADGDLELISSGPVANTRIATTMVDLALFAYIKIIAKINKLQHILSYAEMEEIKHALPHYKLKMGFGLHLGWAIEGAIGSVHKIDASYLSPNVNISARLEAATKQYGVPLLISGQVYDILSPFVQRYCREIDIVTVKGSVLPLKLYTVDLDISALKAKDCKYASVEAGRKKDKRLKKRKMFHEEVRKGQRTSQMIYANDKDLDLMRAGISIEFLKQYEEGYGN